MPSDKDDSGHLSSAHLLGELHDKLDRIASMLATVVTQLNRHIRMSGARDALAERDAQKHRDLVEKTVKMLDHFAARKSEALRKLDADALAQIFPRDQLDAARRRAYEAEHGGEPLHPQTNPDDITLSFTLAGGKKRKNIYKEIAKAVAAAGAGFVIKHLVS